MMELHSDDTLAQEVTRAIRSGDVAKIRVLLSENPGLAKASVVESAGSRDQETARTLLHILTDWPGRFPNSGEMARTLIAAGSEVNARFVGNHTETPLHWAASTGDLKVLNVLVENGANLEAPGSVIGGGTPMANAVAFGIWDAARRLLHHGAKTNLWQAAALGLEDQIHLYLDGNRDSSEPPGKQEITQAFWCACHGGQRTTAELLLGQGADLNWVGYDGLTSLGAARRAGARELELWLLENGATS